MNSDELNRITADMARHCYEQQIEPLIDKQSDLLRTVSKEGGAQVMLAGYIACEVMSNAFATALVAAKPGKIEDVAGLVARMFQRAIEAGEQAVRDKANAG